MLPFPGKVFTAPLFYLNAKPHIGHAYSLVLADALRIAEEKLFSNSSASFANPPSILLVSGTDEHGSKISKAASNANLNVQEFCARNRMPFLNLRQAILGKRPNAFISTSINQNHKQLVQEIWNALQQDGFIYKGKHSGWYCPEDECFVAERDLTFSSSSLPSNPSFKHKQLIWVEEENYKFNFQPLIPRIRKWVAEELELHPAHLKGEIEGYLNEIQDISISRLASSVQWAIPIVQEQSQLQTIYVWFDALIGYLSGAGAFFDCQDNRRQLISPAIDTLVIGKDILKFHSVLFPAMLLALNCPLPRRIIAHSHWLSEGKKMSKSIGNVVDPFLLLEKYSSDSLRYCMLKEAKLDSDSDFHPSLVHSSHANDLVNGFGNLYSRILNQKVLVIQQQEQKAVESKITTIHHSDSFPNQSIMSEPLKRFVESFADSIKKVQFHKAIGSALEFVSLLNGHVSRKEPWRMQKQSKEFNSFIVEIWNCLAVLASLMYPIMPEFCGKMLENMSLERPLTVHEAFDEWRNSVQFVLPIKGKFKKFSQDLMFMDGNVMMKSSTSTTRLKILLDECDKSKL